MRCRPFDQKVAESFVAAGVLLVVLAAPPLGDGKILHSHTFGAENFSQQMLRTEEFGHQPLDRFEPLPVYPFPKRLAKVTDLNSWQFEIEWFLGRPLDAPPVEGRPPGWHRPPGRRNSSEIDSGLPY